MGSAGTPGAGRLWGQRKAELVAWQQEACIRASEGHGSQSGAGHCGQGVSSVPGCQARSPESRGWFHGEGGCLKEWREFCISLQFL